MFHLAASLVDNSLIMLHQVTNKKYLVVVYSSVHGKYSEALLMTTVAHSPVCAIYSEECVYGVQISSKNKLLTTDKLSYSMINNIKVNDNNCKGIRKN